VAIKEYQGTPRRPGKKGYVTKVFSGADLKKARGLLDKQAKESAAKHRETMANWKNPIRNHRGQLRHVSDKSLGLIRELQKANPRLYPKGTPSVRTTVSISGYIKTMPDGTKRVVRDGEEE